MKEKIKKIIKGYLPGFITGLIVCGGVSVIAMTYFPSNQVTYENSESGMQATDVQGAIDELYNTCFPPKTGGEWILDNVDIVDSGDGLYKDEYETGRYIYKGANPNNYVTFNNETAGWRIISINSDGTIKIMRNTSIGNMAWDSSGGTNGSNKWNRPADLNSYLNSTYYNNLTGTAQSQIVSYNFGVGRISRENDNLEDQINNENATKWNGKIALSTVSEYIMTNSNTTCKTFYSYHNNYDTCKNTTWMYSISNDWWTLSPSGSASDVFIVNNSGYIGTNSYVNNSSNIGVKPALYLSSDIIITGGDGSQSNPYIIE